VDSSVTGIVFGVLHPGSGTAWFDSLHLEVVGPPRPRAAPARGRFEPPPRPAEDFTRLLTDAELAVPPDTAAPAENAAWAAWVRANARPIRSLAARDFSDLRFLAPLLRGKRIVQLGESAHGVREFNMAKVRLIQYLHEELGYDVLAFESSLFECDRAGRAAGSLAAVELMRGCIFGVWHTEELVPLFEYVKQTQSTARPLVLTGFDVQASSVRARERPAFLRRVIATIDSTYARHVYQADSAFVTASRAGDRGYARRNHDRLVPLYDSLATWLRARERTLATNFAADPAAPMLARQTAVSMSAFVRQLAVGVGREGTELRDRGMADNLDFVLNELHPGKKVIVWAHNYHVQHRGYNGTTRSDSTGVVRTMGTHVAERHRRSSTRWDSTCIAGPRTTTAWSTRSRRWRRGASSPSCTGRPGATRSSTSRARSGSRERSGCSSGSRPRRGDSGRSYSYCATSTTESCSSTVPGRRGTCARQLR
jgi:erythromycin esterase-like protein